MEIDSGVWPGAGKDGIELWLETPGLALFVAGTCTCSVVETALPDGVRFCGLKPHSAPAGKPEQEKLTICLNPFSGVTVNERLASPPVATVNDELLIASEKSPVAAAATVTVVAAEVDAE